jgi:hypothetical protein
MNAGFQLHLAKPVNAEALTAAVARLGRAPALAESPPGQSR